MTTLIRKTFREEFDLVNLISGNLEMTMKEIKSIKTEMTDLKKSIELTESVLEQYMNGSWILDMSIIN